MTEATSSPILDARLQGRIALITGASSGLGRATALRYAASGARVACADLSKRPAEGTLVEDEITARFGADAATFIAMDVTDEESVKAGVTQAVSWGGGRLDILCNFAGIAGMSEDVTKQSRIHETDSERFDMVMNINTRGTWLCCKYAISQMLLHQEPLPATPVRGEESRGWIVNVASICGLVGHANAPCYVPSKHAVVGITRQLAIDYAQDRIHVNSICPGFIRTNMTERIFAAGGGSRLLEVHPWGSLGTPNDIANAAVFLASDEAAWVTGHNLSVDGGYTCQ